jgi:large subunit ribosomal protein L4
MIEIPVFDKTGEEKSSMQLDEQKLGGKVHMKLLKQAVMMYRANLRQGTVKTKSRNEVAGSTRKLYAQKHTGNARMGMNRTPARRGGGRAFGPKPRDFGWQMPKKARRLATRSALLAKLGDGEVKVVESLALDQIKTKQVARLLQSLKTDGSCLMVTNEYNRNLLISARNVPRTSVASAGELNAYDILRHRWLVVERDALVQLAGVSS